MAKISVTPSTVEEIADDHALLALGRIDRGDEAEPQLLGDTEPAICSAEIVSRAVRPSTDADQQLLRRA